RRRNSRSSWKGDRGCMLGVTQPEPLPTIFAALYALDPAGIVQIPLHRPPQARLEIVLGLPAQLAKDLAGVYGVAAFGTGPVLHVRHQGRAERMRQAGPQRVD